jgi:hypothetical protein
MNIRILSALGAAAVGVAVVACLSVNCGLPVLERNVETLAVQDKPVIVLNTNEACNAIHCGGDETLLLSRADRHSELIIRKSFAREHYLAIYAAGQVQLPVFAASSESLSDEHVDRVLKRATALSVLQKQLDGEMQPYEEAIFAVGYVGDESALEAQRQKLLADESEATAATRHQIQVIHDELKRLMANMDD